MREELSIFISNVYNRETQVVIEEIFNIFKELELPNYEDPYIDLLSSVESNNLSTIADEFRSMLDIGLTEVLKEFGITTTEETTLAIKSKLLDSITTIENYDNSNTILDHLSHTGNTEERFAELLTLVTENTQEYWLMYLESVNDSLINKIIEVHKVKASNENDGNSLDQELLNSILNKVKLIKNNEKYVNSFAISLIREEKIQIGLPFTYYLQIFNKLVNDNIIKTNDFTSVANQLYVFLLISRDGFIDPIQTYQKTSGLIFEDLSKIAQINHLINANIVELDNILADRKNNVKE